MNASGSPIGAALAAPATLVANKADTARIRSEVDIVVPSSWLQIAPALISETGAFCQVKLSIVVSRGIN